MENETTKKCIAAAACSVKRFDDDDDDDDDDDETVNKSGFDSDYIGGIKKMHLGQKSSCNLF